MYTKYGDVSVPHVWIFFSLTKDMRLQKIGDRTWVKFWRTHMRCIHEAKTIATLNVKAAYIQRELTQIITTLSNMGDFDS